MRRDLVVHPVQVLRRRQRRWARRVLRPLVKRRVLPEDNPPDPQVLEDFRFFAILGTWMEEDIVEATVRNAFAQGAEAVYLVDNASTDATVERALSAGATLSQSYETDAHDESLRNVVMNGVVARISLASQEPHIWWLWLDADEFPEGPDGLTIAEYLHTLDHRFRIVGSTYYNHFPSATPSYIPGFHPIDFQPLCERFWPARARHCVQPHWKHPLQRFDREERFLVSGPGFHTGTIDALAGRTREPLAEPVGGIVTHHVQYRQEPATRARLELLCGSDRTVVDHAIGNTQMQKRLRNLDAIYAQNWPQVNNLRGEEPLLGVHPRPWPDPTRTRRWYGGDELAEARRQWSSSTVQPEVLT
jgi:Glycosyl transferase family 2